MSARERLAELTSLLPGGIDCFPRALRWEELISKHHPREPHWYLQTLSVEPASQRRGIGTALIEPGLERADADGVGAYLETQRRDNIPYYERFGFELTDEISLHDSPPLWLMWREPRPDEAGGQRWFLSRLGGREPPRPRSSGPAGRAARCRRGRTGRADSRR